MCQRMHLGQVAIDQPRAVNVDLAITVDEWRLVFVIFGSLVIFDSLLAVVYIHFASGIDYDRFGKITFTQRGGKLVSCKLV